jgi:hypothetical protein
VRVWQIIDMLGLAVIEAHEHFKQVRLLERRKDPGLSMITGDAAI